MLDENAIRTAPTTSAERAMSRGRLTELLALAHRVVVLRQGRIAAELSRAEATPDACLRAMAGIEKGVRV